MGNTILLVSYLSFVFCPVCCTTVMFVHVVKPLKCARVTTNYYSLTDPWCAGGIDMSLKIRGNIICKTFGKYTCKFMPKNMKNMRKRLSAIAFSTFYRCSNEKLTQIRKNRLESKRLRSSFNFCVIEKNGIAWAKANLNYSSIMCLSLGHFMASLKSYTEVQKSQTFKIRTVLFSDTTLVSLFF